MGPELPAPWLLLFTWLPTGEPWGNGSYPGAQVDRKPLLPGLAELATGWAEGLGRALEVLGTGSRRCRDWIEFLPVGTCCFPFISPDPSETGTTQKPRVSRFPLLAVIRHSLVSKVELTDAVTPLLQFRFYFSFHLILAFSIDPEILLFYSWEIIMCPQVYNRYSV